MKAWSRRWAKKDVYSERDQGLMFSLDIPFLVSGRVKVKVLPWPSVLSAQMAPPWYSTIWRVMARPSPVPWLLLVRMSPGALELFEDEV